MQNVKYYLPLIIISLATSLRIYVSCFKTPISKSCVDPIDSIFTNKNKFPGKYLVSFREKSIDLTRRDLPSPYSELLIGMVIGADELGKIPKFKEALKSTGTIHVVVVSGFNVSLVFTLVMRFLGSKYKTKNLVIAQFFTFVYSIMTGFEPPVIRAWIMGSLVSWVKYYGRGVDGFRALVFTALLMLVIWPYFLFSISFQLSFLATLGLIVFGNLFVENLGRVFGTRSFFVEDLGTTISAQVFVLPIVSHYFGRVSILSFLVNPLVLWTVPIATVLGTFYIFSTYISRFLSGILSIFIYPFLAIFTSVVNFFSCFDFSSVNFSVNIKIMALYYVFALLIGIFVNRKGRKLYENK